MKKLSKNLAMYILYFSMFVAMFCTMTLKAEAANVTTGKLGNSNGITWTYDADTKTLTITGEDSGLNGKWDSSKSKFKSPFADICKDVEVIKVQNCTLKGSANAMFANLGTLKRVEFSNVNTAGVTDMTEMFSGCSKLNSVDVSKFDTSNVTSMRGMFYNCSSLGSLDVSKFNTSKVTDMSIMFYSCSSLGSLDVSKFDTSKVTDMSHMFHKCGGLRSLDVSKFNTSNVTNMRNMFSLCGSLSGLDVSGFNTSKVTNMYEMFRDCAKLSSLNVSNFDTSNVTTMLCMFGGCSGLSSLDLSNFNTSKVTDMRNMFYGCYQLSSLDVSGFDTSKVTNMCNMFYGCYKLSSLDVSNFNTSQVTNVQGMFYNCISLSSLDVSKFNTSQVTNMSYMFGGCSSLSSLDVSNFNTSAVINMEYMFDFCKSLSSLDLSNFDTSKVTDMRYMFSNCIELSCLDVSNFDTSKVTDMSYMFSNCTKLSCLDISSFDLSKVEDEKDMFSFCSNLACMKTPKTIPETVSVNLPNTYVNPNGKRTTTLTKNYCNTTLINVDFLVSEIKLNSSSLSIQMGETAQLIATISPEKAINKAVEWKSSNTTVATVDANGKVTAVAPGTATITVTATDGSGVSASCSVTVTRAMSEQERQVRAFVERMYTVALGRASEPSGIDYWSEELLSHRKDGAAISVGFIMSEEFEKKNYSNEEYLKVLYRTFFDREADKDGLSFWLKEMNAGRSRKSVLAGFVNSKEFTQICESYGITRGTMADDATATGAGRFVERLYTIAMERSSDPAGLEDWAKRINNKTNTPEQVAKEFFLSPEYAGKKTSNEKYVETLYLVFMDRTSEKDGKAYWVEQLNKGVSRESVLEGFANSEEFKEIMAGYGL